MRSNTFTISDLFSSSRRYIVPIFQRPYVWDRERQWKPLWEDISDKTNQILDRTRDARYMRSHFLGAVVINQLPTFGRQVPAMEVIDGQQRITTLQILFVALRDFAKKTSASDITFTLTQLTENNMLREHEMERYKIWPTTTDRKLFEAVFTAGSPEALEKLYPLVKMKHSKQFQPRPKLVEAYLYFYNEMSKYTQLIEFEEEVEPSEADVGGAPIAPEYTESYTSPIEVNDMVTVDIDRLYAIMQVLTKHLELVVIELEERDDPQVIFETLNARGEPLLPSDLIRNFVFLRAAQELGAGDNALHHLLAGIGSTRSGSRLTLEARDSPGAPGTPLDRPLFLPLPHLSDGARDAPWPCVSGVSNLVERRCRQRRPDAVK